MSCETEKKDITGQFHEDGVPVGYKTSDYYYDLPQELIAQDPLEHRDASRLLIMNKETGETKDGVFRDVLDHLRPGETLVLNNTRVIPARLLGTRKGTDIGVRPL